MKPLSTAGPASLEGASFTISTCGDSIFIFCYVEGKVFLAGQCERKDMLPLDAAFNGVRAADRILLRLGEIRSKLECGEFMEALEVVKDLSAATSKPDLRILDAPTGPPAA